MTWKVETTQPVSEDLRRIYNHIYRSRRELGGRSHSEAKHNANNRVAEIVINAGRLSVAPHRGTRHLIAGREIRNVTMDRAIYWFTLHEAKQTVRIEAIFYGAKNHMERMMTRLAQTGETG